MGEVAEFGLDLVDQGKRLMKDEMREMLFFYSEAIDDEHVQPREFLFLTLRDGLYIGEVCEFSYSIAQHREFSMRGLYGNYPLPVYSECLCAYLVQNKTGNSRIS